MTKEEFMNSPEFKELLANQEREGYQRGFMDAEGICQLFSGCKYQSVDEGNEQLDIILSDLETVKKCQSYDEHKFHESCHGTGEIVRQATAEEVREFIDAIFLNKLGGDGLIWGNFEVRGFKLKSGKILRMKEGK